ncbi:MAG: fatty acid desaturase [Gammaproteobacteria bacterium]
MISGFIQLPWWGYILVTLGLTHITIASVTLFLHRAQAHRALDLHPVVSHFFRFWLWLTTGMVTKQWVAVHRKHHAKCEGPEDPHSPHVAGIDKVMLEGAELYRKEADNAETLEQYGHGTPNDWLERHLYSKRNFWGVSLLAVIDFLLFGFYGITIWAIQMLWIPFWAAGIINGLGHWWGYRNFEPRDGSTNLINIGFLIGGEEMHNNHHAFPSSAKFSVKPWEFDIGWFYIRILSLLGLAKVRRTAPRLAHETSKEHIDLETARAIISGRMHIMADYARQVIRPVLRQEIAQTEDGGMKALLVRARHALIREESRMTSRLRERLDNALHHNAMLETVYNYRKQLQETWDKTHANQEKLLQSLQEWCQRAEASGIQALQEFAASLRGLTLKTG